MSIAIADYGMGNLLSVAMACARVGLEAVFTDQPGQARQARALILPGVGAFADCNANLRQSGLDQVVRDFYQQDKPVLGICVGMQLMFEWGEEDGLHQGLGIFPGRVVRFPAGRKIPHMGWNTLEFPQPGHPTDGLLAGLAPQPYVYFVHSYHADDASQADAIACTEYQGFRFIAAVRRRQCWGVQFHPEKSAAAGLTILQNFGREAKCL